MILAINNYNLDRTNFKANHNKLVKTAGTIIKHQTPKGLTKGEGQPQITAIRYIDDDEQQKSAAAYAASCWVPTASTTL